MDFSNVLVIQEACVALFVAYSLFTEVKARIKGKLVGILP